MPRNVHNMTGEMFSLVVVLLKMRRGEPFVQDALDAEVIEQDLGITYNRRLWIYFVFTLRPDRSVRPATSQVSGPNYSETS